VTLVQDQGIRRMEERTARIRAGKILAALQKVLVRGRGQATIELFLSGHERCFLNTHADPLIVGVS
jgi:hypothetical protein